MFFNSYLTKISFIVVSLKKGRRLSSPLPLCVCNIKIFVVDFWNSHYPLMRLAAISITPINFLVNRYGKFAHLKDAAFPALAVCEEKSSFAIFNSNHGCISYIKFYSANLIYFSIMCKYLRKNLLFLIFIKRKSLFGLRKMVNFALARMTVWGCCDANIRKFVSASWIT